MNELDLDAVDCEVRKYLSCVGGPGQAAKSDLLYYMQQTSGILDKYASLSSQTTLPREKLHILRLKYIKKLQKLLSFNDPPLRELAGKISKSFYQKDYSKCQYCGHASTTVFNETCYLCENCFAEQYVDRRSVSKIQKR